MDSPPDSPGGPQADAAAERRLVAAAKRGDRRAQAALLAAYEPMISRLVARCRAPDRERADFAQDARLGVCKAIRDWDAARDVPFRPFAWLCARRQIVTALKAAHAHKHRPLNDARRSDQDWQSLTSRSTTADPEAIVAARQQLASIWARCAQLTPLERQALLMTLAGYTRTEIAAHTRGGAKTVDNAALRARRKLRATSHEPDNPAGSAHA